MDEYDIIIIGAGPAGLTAGIYAGRQGSKTLLIDKGICGGLGLEVPLMENYPGFELISGMQLVSQIKKQTEKYVKIKENEGVVHIMRLEEGFEIATIKDKYFAKAIILAMGRKHRKLNIPGEKEFAGFGVSYCATCDGFFYKDKKVIVVGGGNSALQEAIFLKNIGIDVTIVHRRDKFRGTQYSPENIKKKGIKIILNSNVVEIKGDKNVKSVILMNNKNEKKEIKIDGVFVSIGSDATSEIAHNINVKLDENKQIITDKKQRTNIPFVYSAGDITGGLQQWIVACSEGAIAATSAYEDKFLKQA